MANMLVYLFLIHFVILTRHISPVVTLDITTTPRPEYCTKLSASNVRTTLNYFIQELNSSNDSSSTNDTLEYQDTIYPLQLFEITNNTESCFLRYQNSAICQVLETKNTNLLSLIPVNSSFATCEFRNASFKICFTDKETLCNCRQWYLVHPYCSISTNINIQTGSNNTTTSKPCTFTILIEESSQDTVSNECHEKKPNLLEEIRVILMLVLVGISVLSLLASVVVHLLLFRSSHDVLPLLCHKFTLLICYISFLLRSFRGFSENIVCVYGALYFSSECCFLASFLWLNVLAYEMWRQFHPKRVYQRCLHHFQCTKLAFQSLYGWGGPAILMGIYCLLHLISDDHLFLYDGACPIYFKRNIPQAVFIAAVNEVALFISMVFFVLTVINIKKIKASIAEASSNKRMFWTYVKLMTMASFSAAFYVLKNAIPPKGKEQMYWIPADILISLHGFLLFLLDCSNSNIRRCLKSGLQRASSSFRT